MNETTRSSRTGSVSRLDTDQAPPSSRRRGSGHVGHTSTKSAAAADLREISALVRRDGPLSPEQAVSFVRRAARAAGAPETGKRAQTEGRNLVFSLGVMLFVALTGLAPRDAHVANDLSSPPAPSAFSPYAVNASLDAIVRTCLANQPDDRFSSAAELNVALSALAIGEHVALDHRVSRA